MQSQFLTVVWDSTQYVHQIRPFLVRINNGYTPNSSLLRLSTASPNNDELFGINGYMQSRYFLLHTSIYILIVTLSIMLDTTSNTAMTSHVYNSKRGVSLFDKEKVIKCGFQTAITFLFCHQF